MFVFVDAKINHNQVRTLQHGRSLFIKLKATDS